LREKQKSPLSEQPELHEVEVGVDSSHYCTVVVPATTVHAFVFTDYPTGEFAMNAGRGPGDAHVLVPANDVPTLKDPMNVDTDELSAADCRET